MSIPTITITILLDLDDDLYRLYCTSHGHTSIVGPRIFRAPPHPEIAFVHDTQEAAEEAAQALRDYLAGLPQKKPSKKAQQKFRD